MRTSTATLYCCANASGVRLRFASPRWYFAMYAACSCGGSAVGVDGGPAVEDHDVAAGLGAAEVQRHLRVGLDRLHAQAARERVDAEALRAVPEEPHRVRDRLAARRDRRQPHHFVVGEMLRDALSEVRAFVDHRLIVRSRPCESIVAAFVVMCVLAAPARAHDSLAPAGAGHNWLPDEEWVHRHWLPFDERELEAALGLRGRELEAYLYDDHHTLAGSGSVRGALRSTGSSTGSWRGGGTSAARASCASARCAC